MLDVDVDEDALAFFNQLSGRLKIELTEEPERVSPKLMNLVARPSATLVSLSLRMGVFEDGTFRELSEEEWTRVVLRTATVRMRNSRVETVIEHASPNGKTFTVRDLAAAVEETERRVRGSDTWFGGIDAHHVFFEGLRGGAGHLGEDALVESAAGVVHRGPEARHEVVSQFGPQVALAHVEEQDEVGRAEVGNGVGVGIQQVIVDQRLDQGP
jgi:hypothetical protein